MAIWEKIGELISSVVAVERPNGSPDDQILRDALRAMEELRQRRPDLDVVELSQYWIFLHRGRQPHLRPLDLAADRHSCRQPELANCRLGRERPSCDARSP